MPRTNDNGARSKSSRPRTVPVSADLVRLYADYLHGEYGDLDSDYVFVNLWGEPHGHPLTYAAVYDLVKRLRRRTGVDFDPHWYRHSYATGLLRTGVPVEVVSKLLGHASVTTTVKVYGHLTVEDARAVLENAGWFADSAVSCDRPPVARGFGGTVGAVDGGGSTRVPQQAIGFRRGRPGVRWRCLPDRAVSAAGPRAGDVSGTSAAVGQGRPAGSGGVRRA